MKKIRKHFIALSITVLLLFVSAVSITYAYVTRETAEITNRFTFGDSDEGIDVRLTEPDWDGVVDYEYDDGAITPIYAYENEDPIYGYEDGDPQRPVLDKNNPDVGTKPETGREYGEDLAAHTIPGIVIPKNPFITNIGTESDIWVAAKVTFVYSQGHAKAGEPVNQWNYQYLTEVLEVDWNEEDWEVIEDTGISKVFYYRQPLERAAEGSIPQEGGKTESLFTNIKVKGSASNAQMEKLHEMGGFSIYVEGFATMKQNGSTYDSFRSWGLEGGVFFDHTPAEGRAVDVTRPGITGK